MNLLFYEKKFTIQRITGYQPICVVKLRLVFLQEDIVMYLFYF